MWAQNNFWDAAHIAAVAHYNLASLLMLQGTHATNSEPALRPNAQARSSTLQTLHAPDEVRDGETDGGRLGGVFSSRGSLRVSFRGVQDSGREEGGAGEGRGGQEKGKGEGERGEGGRSRSRYTKEVEEAEELFRRVLSEAQVIVVN